MNATLSNTITEDNIIDLNNYRKQNHISHSLILQHGAADPIRNESDIEAAKQYFLTYNTKYKSNHINIRNYTFFVLSCNCARRVSDVLRLKIRDVINSDKTVKNFVLIREKKTNKTAKVYFNQEAKEAISLYISVMDTVNYDDYLFKSRQGCNKAISRTEAYNIMKDMGKAIGLEDKGYTISCHTPRKTFGLKATEHGIPISMLSELYGHSSEKVTRRYIGLTDVDIENVYMNVEI